MTDLVERLRALQATLAQMTDSEFSVACSGEFCEDFKNTIEGCIANGLDRIEQLKAEIARKDALIEKAVQAGLDAAAVCVESNRRGMFNYEEDHAYAIRALSASEIVKEMCGE